MLTLHDLTEGIKPTLHYLEAPVSRAPRLVEQVVVCGDSWTPSAGAGDGQVRGALVIAPAEASWLNTPGDTERRMLTLERQGAVGVIVASRAKEVPELALVASRCGTLPLMVPAIASSAASLQTLIQRHQIEALRHHARQQARLLEMAPRLDLTHEGPHRLMRWLERQTGARVTVIRGRDDRVWQAMAEAGHDRLLADLRMGRISAGMLEVGGQHCLLHTLGGTAPYRILVARRPMPWPYPARALVPKVAGQLTLVSYQVELQAREQRLARTEAANRTAVLQALMSGDLVQAERVAAPLLPELLATGAGEICVLECSSGDDRRAAAAACDQALGWKALSVLCPTDDRHIVICRPHTDGSPNALELLSPVLRSHPQRAIGASMPLPWARTAEGYSGAIKALANARTAQGRIAVHSTGKPLSELLPGTAKAWAAAVLRPVWEAVETEPERRHLWESTRLGVTFGPMRAAKLLGEMQPEGRSGPHRNTVAKRLLTVSQRAGLGRNLGDRAVLDLAMQLVDAPGELATLPVCTPSLHTMLQADSSIAEWASRLLEPLTPEQQELLAVWMSREANIQETAKTIGVHRNTLRVRLETVAAAVARPLLEPGNGSHDALFALIVKGKLPPSILPDPIAGIPYAEDARTAA
ncbi:helix-turn-helix domain-containing protein [Streptomyces lydicus]|uniref:helix-turn-helix domain-containing protein n=1 Tax=Streptomyces lydicus TaxID=47763 RepID=UPI00379002F3